MIRHLKLILLTLLLSAFSAPILAKTVLRVGYVNEWPLPAHFGRSDGRFDAALNGGVGWTAFGNAADIIAALKAGDIDIALSLGITPVLVAQVQGLDIVAIDIAASYPEAAGCILKPVATGGDKLEALRSARVGVALGTLPHYLLLDQLPRLGIDAGDLTFFDLPPVAAASALRGGEIDVACAWGSVFATLATEGTPIASLPGARGDGPEIYDMIVTTQPFLADNSELVQGFLATNESLLVEFANDREHMLTAIAAAVNMTVPAARRSLNGISFPPISARAGAAWLDGAVAANLRDVAEYFVQQATLDKIPDGLDSLADPAPLKAVIANATTEPLELAAPTPTAAQ